MPVLGPFLYRKLGLRTCVIGATLALIAAPVVLVGVCSVGHQNSHLQAILEAKHETMRDALTRRGVAVARNIAMSAQHAIPADNVAQLADVIQTTLRHDSEIAYGMIVSQERRAVVHSDARLVGQQLSSPDDVFAAQQADVATRAVMTDSGPVLEVIAPIVLLDKPWGAVRLGFSLKSLNDTMSADQDSLRHELQRAVLTHALVALALMLVAGPLARRAANGIMARLQALLEGVRRIHAGDVAVAVPANGGPDFVALAGAFNEMSAAVKKRATDLTIALSEARDASRHKSEFIANVSHELRTPLNALVNIPELLLEDFQTRAVWGCSTCKKTFEPPAPPPAGANAMCPKCQAEMALQKRWVHVNDGSSTVHFIQRLHQSSKYLLHVINDLLDFSKLEAGKMKLYTRTIDLPGLKSELAASLESMANQRELIVHYSGFSDVILRADPVKLQQVLTNLIGNAIKFTLPKGAVFVRCTTLQENGCEMVSFAVQDSGIGIPKDRYTSIFESFRQVDGSHTRAHQGTGLGLTISKQLVELHGGRIWVESEIGKGSTFTFVIPREGIADPLNPFVPDLPDANNLSVLLIDDDHTQAVLASRILSTSGYTVEIITDPQLAMSRALELNPGVILLDVMMPHVSGLTLLRLLKQHPKTKRTPVVVTTAFHANRDAVIDLGGIWLPKPWSDGALQTALFRAGEQRRLPSAADDFES